MLVLLFSGLWMFGMVNSVIGSLWIFLVLRIVFLLVWEVLIVVIMIRLMKVRLMNVEYRVLGWKIGDLWLCFFFLCLGCGLVIGLGCQGWVGVCVVVVWVLRWWVSGSSFCLDYISVVGSISIILVSVIVRLKIVIRLKLCSMCMLLVMSMVKLVIVVMFEVAIVVFVRV